jgi:hypothetical protein
MIDVPIIIEEREFVMDNLRKEYDIVEEKYTFLKAIDSLLVFIRPLILDIESITVDDELLVVNISLKSEARSVSEWISNLFQIPIDSLDVKSFDRVEECRVTVPAAGDPFNICVCRPKRKVEW